MVQAAVAQGADWLLAQTGAGAPAWNMAYDEVLLERIRGIGAPVLRFYSWTVPAATFGYSQAYADVAQLTLLRPLIRRPTGGGVVPHDGDWTYTLCFPPHHEWHRLKALQSYERVHRWLSTVWTRLKVSVTLAGTRAASPPGHCFLQPVAFDLMYGGRKIAGAAQRRNKNGLLIQGSVQPPVSVAKADWQQAVCDVAVEQWGIQWSPFSADGAFLESTDRLSSEKYGQDQWNQS